MEDRLRAALEGLVERLLAQAAEDADLRAALRQFALAVADACEEPPAAVEPAPPPVEERRVTPPPLPPLRIGSQVEEREPLPKVARGPVVADGDLPLIESRCRLKAEGARWAAVRQRRIREGAAFQTEIEPKDREIIDKAKQLSDCFLWMNHPDNPPPANLGLLDDVAGCFEVSADALALVRQFLDQPEEDPDLFEEAVDLVAEAQSALRAAIERVDGPRDNDQLLVFSWLRRTAAEHQIYVRRHMRADDPADPSTWPQIDARIGAVDEKLQQQRQQEKQRRARIKRIRYHVQQVLSGGGTDHDWTRIIETTEEMLSEGVPPSNRELREILLPAVDLLPEDREFPAGFRLVLREIDHFLASRSGSTDAESTAAPTAEVQRAAELLGGRSVVIIGGDRRPHAHSALRSALDLKDLIWIETREHESLDGFEPYVARDDVALVILAIRWASHSYGDVKTFCDRYGKPLLRLPGGYSPNQVAHQVVAQCAERLGSA